MSGKANCKEHLLRILACRSFPTPSLDRNCLPAGGSEGIRSHRGGDSRDCSLDLQLVVLGKGQQKYHDLFRQFASQYPAKIAVQLSFDNALAHKIEAGCDMFLMPSRFEPCGSEPAVQSSLWDGADCAADGGLATRSSLMMGIPAPGSDSANMRHRRCWPQ